MNFLNFLIKEFLNNRIPIIRPDIEESNENVWESILNHNKIDSPRDVFSSEVSPTAILSLKSYCSDVCKYIDEAVKIFDYEGILECLNGLNYLNLSLDQRYMGENIHKCVRIVF